MPLLVRVALGGLQALPIPKTSRVAILDRQSMQNRRRHLSLGQDLPQQHDLPKRFALCSDARRANNEGPANRS